MLFTSLSMRTWHLIWTLLVSWLQSNLCSESQCGRAIREVCDQSRNNSDIVPKGLHSITHQHLVLLCLFSSELSPLPLSPNLPIPDAFRDQESVVTFSRDINLQIALGWNYWAIATFGEVKQLIPSSSLRMECLCIPCCLLTLIDGLCMTKQ